MNQTETLAVKCPHCGSELRVDTSTGDVLLSKKAEKRDVASFDAALERERERQSRHKDLFSQAFEQEQKRKERLEKKFAEARKEADKTPEPPTNPFDLD